MMGPRILTETPTKSRANQSQEHIDLSGASILLVDDNLQNLELMQAYLEELPCEIRTAADGVEAAAKIETQCPDLILLDVMMPRMSGFELCQKIKANPDTRDTVIIMVTALHEVGDFERAVECGTNDFITKPVNKLELLTRVRSLLELRMLKRRYDQMIALKQRRGIDDRGRPEAGQKLDEADDS
jgi:two-component system alkaline phosphatase synthesis response regulator PhoP